MAQNSNNELQKNFKKCAMNYVEIISKKIEAKVLKVCSVKQNAVLQFQTYGQKKSLCF